ncbi:MAG: NADH-quinone oxidoreductase subunit NuoK [Dehalococcoidales bacterium]|jgi:NADH:ubiquinone oxidoreductase subunit K|nr:NADH-quinone oxidoreductase subunit NuoK [Dehalococcoidales bacterium]MDD4230461.1 NADH-quinone oxidoreductase subunit NuoK [Dehalococcoidales bacterium]MDD4465732.1 NADH-quinone oxidoreductase subunit NuoK [Dehalococcoidales bacterium]
MPGLEHYLILSALLFCIGLTGAIIKRNAVVILMCIEIMLAGVNVAMVAFSRFITPLQLGGQLFTIFIIIVAAAEVAIGLAIILALYRKRQTVDTEKTDFLKW